MADVYCSSSVSISLSDEEQAVLQKAHDILEETRHMWFVRDDNAWDHEDYFRIENAVETLEEVFHCDKKK